MKYPPSEYAKYLLSLRESPLAAQKTNIKKFAEALRKNGDLKDWQKIEQVYESLLNKKTEKKTATISYFGDIHKTKIKDELSGYDVEFEEDKNLKGGIRIKIGDVRIDNSIAGRLAEVKKALS